MTFVAKAAWFAAAVIANAVAVFFVTDYLVSRSTSGFGVTQTHLTTQMTALQGSLTTLQDSSAALQASVAELQASLDAMKARNDEQAASAQNALSKDVTALAAVVQGLDAKIAQSMGETATQLAAFQAASASAEKRLGDAVARQQRVETLLLRQRVFYGPPPNTVEGTDDVVGEWKKAGFDVTPLLQFDEGQAMREWSGLLEPVLTSP